MSNASNGAETSSKTSRVSFRLLLGALGIVYGDIGTSPLYALKECFVGPFGIALNSPNILGILSLIFWSLTLVVVVKYLTFIMRAHNNGEGGVTALMALMMPHVRGKKRSFFKTPAYLLFGLVGAALLYGDGMITPAISVLSAVEGLEVATPVFTPYIVPLTVLILIALFLTQKRGTGFLGLMFGPMTLIWFISISAVGIPWIIKHPLVLSAVNPGVAIQFFMEHGKQAFWVLSAVVLCVTGAEALYADMGHFGVHPIRKGWYWVVYPALVLNYFGQGAMLIEKGVPALSNPFYSAVPSFFLFPMVLIATFVTVGASQALISGAFSLTQQAIQLGYLPRIPVIHTSDQAEGQIYIPKVNAFLMVSTVLLVLFFQESSHLAAAYGIAVTGTMAMTSLLFYGVARRIWGWSFWWIGLLTAAFLIIDLSFFTANIVKFMQGGWVPVVIAGSIFFVMLTWRRGRKILSAEMMLKSMPIPKFIELIGEKKPLRIPGISVFMTPNVDVAPGILLHQLEHNQVLHKRTILLNVTVAHVPYVPFYEHARMTDLGEGISQIIATYGYMQRPLIMEILRCAESAGLPHASEESKNMSFFLGRDSLVITGKSDMAHWRKRFFCFLSRNAQPATAFFGIPPDQVIELGVQLEM